MAQMVGLDPIPQAPHVPVGQRMIEMQNLANKQTLDTQAIQQNKLELNKQRESARQAAVTSSILSKGLSEQETARQLQQAGLAQSLADYEKIVRSKTLDQLNIDTAQIKKANEHSTAMKPIVEGLESPKPDGTFLTDSEKQIMWGHSLDNLAANGDDLAKSMDRKYDPIFARQYLDMGKHLDNMNKITEEARKVKEQANKDAEAAQKAQAAADAHANSGNTPDLQEFNKSGYYQTYLRDHKIDASTLNPTTEAAVHGDAFTAFKQAQLKPSTQDRYDQGFASFKTHPELVKKYGGDNTGYDQYLKDQQAEIAAAGRAATNAAQNPGASEENVKYIADQVENDPTGQIFTKLVGSDKKLKDQVTTELRSRDADLRTLTSATRQLGETAHTLMPDFDKAITMLKSPTLQKKMDDVVGPRWQEFLAGKVGKGDPEYDKLRTFVSLLQTGTMRAHVGARGSSQMTTKFENLFNANKMDAATLTDTLTTTKEFLKGYEDAVYKNKGTKTPSTNPFRK